MTRAARWRCGIAQAARWRCDRPARRPGPALGRLGVACYQLGGLVDHRVWPSLVASLARQLQVRQVLHLGPGGPVLERLLRGQGGEAELEVVDLPLDASGCRALLPDPGRASCNVLLTATRAAAKIPSELPAGKGPQRLQLVLPAPSPGPAVARRADLRGSLGVADGARLALMASDLLPLKRPEDFVALAHRLKMRDDLRFLLVGEGPLAGAVLDLARFLGLSRFTLEPPLLTLPELVAAADVVVSTAEAEPFPRALLLAMAQGTPLVASAVDDLPELLAAAGERGALVSQVGNVEETAQAVLRMLTLGAGPPARAAGPDAGAVAARRELREALLGRAQSTAE